jgi:sugar/nucleoside kinase (ribokinase family)
LGECDPSLVTHFYGKSFVGMTPQGWMRRVDDEGRVYGDAWLGAETLLPLASAVVVSIEDLRGSWDLARVWASQAELLAVTRGWEGATLFVGGEEHRLAAPDVLQVDPTGAGDIFAAVLFCALSEGWEPLAAARQAICVASQTVAREGLLGVPAAAEIGACHNRVSDEGR